MRYIGILIFMLFMLASCSSKRGESREQNMGESNNSIEIMELFDDNPTQVEKIHNLLNNNKVVYNNKVIEEWKDSLYVDELDSDFDFSEGKIVSATLFDGNPNSARKIWNEVDSVLSTKYTLLAPYKAKEWTLVNGLPCMQYFNFYETGYRRISIKLYLYSETEDEDNVQNAQVVIGFGGS